MYMKRVTTSNSSIIKWCLRCQNNLNRLYTHKRRVFLARMVLVRRFTLQSIDWMVRLVYLYVFSKPNRSLQVHINRAHTAPEKQISYSCDKCSYKTFYKGDLPRHRRRCTGPRPIFGAKKHTKDTASNDPAPTAPGRPIWALSVDASIHSTPNANAAITVISMDSW